VGESPQGHLIGVKFILGFHKIV